MAPRGCPGRGTWTRPPNAPQPPAGAGGGPRQCRVPRPSRRAWPAHQNAAKAPRQDLMRGGPSPPPAPPSPSPPAKASEDGRGPKLQRRPPDPDQEVGQETGALSVEPRTWAEKPKPQPNESTAAYNTPPRLRPPRAAPTDAGTALGTTAGPRRTSAATPPPPCAHLRRHTVGDSEEGAGMGNAWTRPSRRQMRCTHPHLEA